jgi:tetratricopeptide (TPR) repeat protein
VYFVVALACSPFSSRAEDSFSTGIAAFQNADYQKAAQTFQDLAAQFPSPGALDNLGLAEWEQGRPGHAVLAWEQARWISPRDANARSSLRFARRAKLLETPELAWFEICSTWLAPDSWACLAATSFWLMLALLLLPGIFRWRRTGWHQAAAAACFAVFLLTLPALMGIHTRAKTGVILNTDTPLRLTPTADGQTMAKLSAGETVRLKKIRGQYAFVQTSAATGWISRPQLALVVDGIQR